MLERENYDILLSDFNTIYYSGFAYIVNTNELVNFYSISQNVIDELQQGLLGQLGGFFFREENLEKIFVHFGLAYLIKNLNFSIEYASIPKYYLNESNLLENVIDYFNNYIEENNNTADIKEENDFKIHDEATIKNNFIEYVENAKRKLIFFDFDGAFNEINKLIKLYPNIAESYYHRGYIFYITKNYNKAINDFNQAIKIDSGFDLAYFLRGMTKYQQQDYQAAVEDFDKVIELNPSDAEAHYNRGMAKSALEKYLEANEDFDKAIELNPNYAKAYFYRGLNFLILSNAIFFSFVPITKNTTYLQLGYRDLKKAADLGYDKAYDILEKYFGES
jgi:tetratricopeptide (TPR) repeat protein